MLEAGIFICITLYKTFGCLSFNSWTGDKALKELEESNITRECFPILLNCFTKVSQFFAVIWLGSQAFIRFLNVTLCLLLKAIRTSKEAEMESDMLHLSGISILTLEGFFAS